MHDTILIGDAAATLATLPGELAHCIVTSPPYWGLRDYGVQGQIGLERTPLEYIAQLVTVFREARRVLRADGTLWLNLGDTYCTDASIREQGRRSITDDRRGVARLPPWHDYARRGRVRRSATLAPLGLKDKDLIGLPWRVALALQADGWYLRSAIIWYQRGGKQRRERDRPQSSYEYLFLLAKSARYAFDVAALEPEFIGDVWEVNRSANDTEHTAVMPEALVTPCVLASTLPGGLVLDPFFGTGTVGAVARRHSRRYVGVELNPAYATIAQRRIDGVIQPDLWSA